MAVSSLNENWKNNQATKVNTSGLTGYAKTYADALKSGSTPSQATTAAQQATGGSGLTQSYINQVLKGTGTTSESQGIKYDPNTGYAIPQNPTKTEEQEDEDLKNKGIDLTSLMPQLSGLMSQYSAPYESLLKDMLASSQGTSKYETMLTDMMNKPSAISQFMPQLMDLFNKPKAATDQTALLELAQKKADLQTSPLLSALASQRSKAGADYSNLQGEINAAYAGVPEQTQAALDEARRYAQENAIARGMGRSGVVDWTTAKLSAPLLQQQTQAEREKAAKLSGAANTYNALISDLARQETETAGQKGKLVDTTLADLMSQERQYGLQEGQVDWNKLMGLTNLGMQDESTNWNKVMGLANLGTQTENTAWDKAMGLAGLAGNANNAQSSLLASLIPLYLYG